MSLISSWWLAQQEALTHRGEVAFKPSLGGLFAVGSIPSCNCLSARTGCWTIPECSGKVFKQMDGTGHWYKTHFFSGHSSLSAHSFEVCATEKSKTAEKHVFTHTTWSAATILHSKTFLFNNPGLQKALQCLIVGQPFFQAQEENKQIYHHSSLPRFQE